MAFTVDVREDGTPVRWELDDDGATPHAHPDYEPTCYAAARNGRDAYLDWLADALEPDPKVTGTELRPDRWYTSLDADEPATVLEISLERLGEVRQVAREIRQREQADHAPGVLELYDVDLDPQFRYCLDTGADPAPSREPRTLSLSLPPAALAEDDPSALRIEGEPAGENLDAVCERVESVLAECDPDVLFLSAARIVPLLAEAGVDLGRRGSGYAKLAGESTYASYGRVGHSPARYDVPGRVLIDRSNSFLLPRSNLAGLAYFVEQAGKPLQEIAHDSIGGVLTALEIRHAREEWDVLAPWQKRQTERWKSLETLHAADRGGFTFQPDAGVLASAASEGSLDEWNESNGVHEDVHELDFASLYPNVMREYRISPETVCCDCHDREDVPELGYTVCPDPGPPGRGNETGFLGEVLGPLLDDRRDRKEWLREVDGRTVDDATATGDGAAYGGEPVEDVRAIVEAIKWVLVSCFGYQGYRHAKFGRIETHEAINAHARDVLLTAKDHLEDAGWRIVHGIVDSLWVTADPDREQRPIREVAEAVTADVGIELEYEGQFDWVAFCPRKRASGAALMRYVGHWSDETLAAGLAAEPYKFRGIETRQRSTCPFVATAQRDLVDVLDRERDPGAVCERLARHLATLRRGTVPTGELVVTQRVSKRAGEYERASLAKAALERAAAIGFERHPGQDVRYVVVADDRTGPERVRLAFEVDGEAGTGPEAGVACDPDFYADRLVRACESVLAPLGWDEGDVRSHLRETRDATLRAFGG